MKVLKRRNTKSLIQISFFQPLNNPTGNVVVVNIIHILYGFN